MVNITSIEELVVGGTIYIAQPNHDRIFGPLTVVSIGNNELGRYLDFDNGNFVRRIMLKKHGIAPVLVEDVLKEQTIIDKGYRIFDNLVDTIAYMGF